MKYDLDYEGMKEMFDDLNKKRNDLTGKRVHCNWLSEFNENILEEGERLNVLLPLMQRQTGHNDVTEEIEGEMGGYDAFINNNFEEEIDEEERGLVKKIFLNVIIKHFINNKNLC